MPGAGVGWRLESELPGRTHGRSRAPTAKLLKENHTLTPFSSLVAARAGCLRSQPARGAARVSDKRRPCRFLPRRDTAARTGGVRVLAPVCGRSQPPEALQYEPPAEGVTIEWKCIPASVSYLWKAAPRSTGQQARDLGRCPAVATCRRSLHPWGVGYSDLTARSMIQPKPTNVPRLNSTSVSNPNRSRHCRLAFATPTHFENLLHWSPPCRPCPSRTVSGAARW